MKDLKRTLEKFYREYDFDKRVPHDPIRFPHRYRTIRDIEVSGFIAACLAYGRVGLFTGVVEKMLTIMGKSPYDFLLDFNLKKHEKLFDGIKYRFNENADLICLLFLLHKLLHKYSSIERAFKSFYSADDPDIGKGLTGLMDTFLEMDTSPVYGANMHPPGLTQFFPSPEKGSACKRANLFLRWMIRDRDIDFGIWKGVPKNKLIIPLDTHIARISRCLGFTKRRSQGWKAALEITGALKKFDPEDPLKYDFALCHHGISGMCKGMREKEGCKGCVFNLRRGH